ncbi:MAG: hypothetical protein CL920_19625 [Deltaproteobacteria bacterium]|nr:hypothetical protein [Deltaproteobacteria bacterium]
MVNVTSEVGKLKRVLVHEPGREVDQMTPSMMEELLFDDILDGEGARSEHGLFRRTMQLLGIEVLESQQLLLESLRQEGALEWFWNVYAGRLPEKVYTQLKELEVEGLVNALVHGVRRKGNSADFKDHDLFDVHPIPNWCFQRDPQVVIGNGVLFCSMATKARRRETLLSRLIFRFHPSLQGTPILFDAFEEDKKQPIFLGREHLHIEGGDLLVLSKDVVAVGYSERTNVLAIQYLARALAQMEDGPKYLVVVEIPKKRAYMHLDTIMTPVDHDACLVYPAAIMPGGSEEATAYEFDLHASELTPSMRGNVLQLLARRGLDYEPILCGGTDPLHQQREQWTDGANTFTLAPGMITLYDRNRVTADELIKHGFRIVSAEDLVLGRAEADLNKQERVCIMLPSHEISRARGGPHCLTHPLERF